MVTGQDFFMNRRDFHDGRSRFFFASLVLINLRGRGVILRLHLLVFGFNQGN